MSYCHVICCLDICANEQFISWLYVNARNWLNKDFLKHKMQNMFDIFDIIKLETKIGSTCYVFVNRIKGERMVSICMVPTVKHGWGGVKVCGCLAGDTIGDNSKHTEPAWLPQHPAETYHPIQFAMIPNTPPGCLTRKESDGVLWVISDFFV